MAVLTRSRRPAGPQPPGQAPRRARRRSVPLAAGGVVLVVVCALVFAEGWLQAGHRQPVLTSRPTGPGRGCSRRSRTGTSVSRRYSNRALGAASVAFARAMTSRRAVSRAGGEASSLRAATL
jgi:hypothetical protein